MLKFGHKSYLALWSFQTTLIVLLTAACSGQTVTTETILDSLHSVFTYYKGHPQNVDHNLVFGTLLVKGGLEALRARENEKLKLKIEELITMCDYIITNHPFDWSLTSHAAQLVKSFESNINRDSGLTAETPNYPVENNLETGSPSRSDSDVCILNLLMDGVSTESCEALAKDPEAKGYTLLHQAIYFTLKLNIIGAEEKKETKAIIKSTCGKMLGENRQIRKSGLPLKLQDLFVEQVCGLSKYAEFLTDGTLRMILSLQTSRGCFAMRERQKHL